MECWEVGGRGVKIGRGKRGSESGEIRRGEGLWDYSIIMLTKTCQRDLYLYCQCTASVSDCHSKNLP